MGLTPSETIMKLLTYTFFMFAAPLVTYRTSQDYILPELYRRHPQWQALGDEGSRAVFSGGEKGGGGTHTHTHTHTRVS